MADPPPVYNTRDAWAGVAGDMETDLALALQRLGAPGLTGPLVLAVRASLYYHVATVTYQRPDATADVKRLVIETLTG